MKIRNLKITSKMADKHKKTMNALYIITYILLFPFVILDYLSDFLEWLCNKMCYFRADIVYTTFKIIYKKEIIVDMQKKKEEWYIVKENRLNKLKKFLKEKFKKRIQAFDTRNTEGDSMETIYNEDGITVDYCYYYGYIEIFGLTDEEYKELEKEKIIY